MKNADEECRPASLSLPSSGTADDGNFNHECNCTTDDDNDNDNDGEGSLEWMISSVPETPLELGQRDSCVSQL